MPGIQRAQQIHDFAAPAFAHHNAVRPHTQRRAYQLRQPYGAFAFHVGAARHQRHVVGMVEHAKFAHLLHGDDALPRRASHKHCFEQRGFACSGSAGHEHAGPSFHESFQQGHPSAWKHAVFRQRFQTGRNNVRQSYADGGALRNERCDNRVHAHAFHRGRVGYRAGVVEPSAKLRAQPHGEIADGLGTAEWHAQCMWPHTLAAIHPHRSVAGYRDVGDARLGCDVAKWPEFHD